LFFKQKKTTKIGIYNIYIQKTKRKREWSVCSQFVKRPTRHQATQQSSPLTVLFGNRHSLSQKSPRSKGEGRDKTENGSIAEEIEDEEIEDVSIEGDDDLLKSENSGVRILLCAG